MIDKRIDERLEQHPSPRQILITKIIGPALHANHILRPRLEKSLLRGMQTNLTLLVAPAGYGKTTLLSQWSEMVKKDGWKVAWLSLDEYDNDPQRFWMYIVEALGSVQPSIKNTLIGLQRQVCGPEDCALLAGLINETSNSLKPISLVLDDYHMITNPSIHQDLEYLLQYLPANLHLVIASRTPPQLSLKRLRANLQVVDAGIENLSFTLEETGLFFERVMALSLKDEEIRQLFGLMEGWVVGLQLAGLSLKKSKDVAGFLSGISGAQMQIMDYLGDVVFKQLDERSKNFLMQTSILDRMTPSLCDAVRQESDSAEMLENLVKANLFIFRTHEKSAWYHCHVLFREFMQHELTWHTPQLVSDLHLRASRWYEADGSIPEAIDHALSAGEKHRIYELFDTSYSMILNAHLRGNVWLDSLFLNRIPNEMIWDNLSLSKLYIWILIKKDQTENILTLAPIFKQFEEASKKEAELRQGSDEARRELDLIRLQATMLLSDFALARQLAFQHLSAGQGEDAYFLNTVKFVYGYSCERTGEIPLALQNYGEIVYSAQNEQELLPAFVRILFVRLLRLQGKLNQAARLCQVPADKVYSSEITEWHCIDGVLSISLGRIQLEWGQPDLAAASIERGVELIRRYVKSGGNKYWLNEASSGMASFKLAQGNLPTAWDILSQPQCNDSNLTGCYGIKLDFLFEKGKLAVLVNDLDQAHFLEKTARERISSNDAIYGIAWKTLRVRIALAEQKLDDASTLIDEALESASQGGLVNQVVELMILRALVYQANEKKFSAVHQMIQALQLAQPENMLHTIIFLSPDIGRLLYKTLQHTAESEMLFTHKRKLLEYIQKLLNAFNTHGEAVFGEHLEAETAPAKLVKELTEKELEILRLMNSGLSNSDIARRLVISNNTLRTHLKHIYEKLDVHDLHQAIIRAREYRLV